MVKQKRQLRSGAALTLLLALLPFLLLVGCKADKDLPFYQFEDDETPVLTVDGVRYIEDYDVIRDRSYASGLFWNFIGEIGDAIGVCGGNEESGGFYKIWQIEGDEDQNFLYVLQNRFAPGPYYTYFCAREDLQMMPPSVETVSSVTLAYGDAKSTSAQVDDLAMVAALLETFSRDGIQTLNGEGWVGVSLIMQHKDFPFLQCEIKCRYSPEQEISYCQNENREWLILPAEWFEVISEHGSPIRDE